MEVKVKLKQEITEGQFLEATFDDENFNVGVYDIDTMKNTFLTGKTNNVNGLLVHIPDYEDGYTKFGYDKEDVFIWEYELIKE